MFSDVSELLVLIFLPSSQYQCHILFSTTCETKGYKQEVVMGPNKISKRPRHSGRQFWEKKGNFSQWHWWSMWIYHRFYGCQFTSVLMETDLSNGWIIRFIKSYDTTLWSGMRRQETWVPPAVLPLTSSSTTSKSFSRRASATSLHKISQRISKIPSNSESILNSKFS